MIPEREDSKARRSGREAQHPQELENRHFEQDGDFMTADDAALIEEIGAALQERDIIGLRSQLKQLITQTDMTSSTESRKVSEAYFGLSEEVFNPVNLDLEGGEPELGNYLQQLHIKNHTVASREIVHDLYTEEAEVSELDFGRLSAEDEYLFEEIGEAVMEKEIIDLRANLRSIAQGTSKHEHSMEEIEGFLSGDLDAMTMEMIREEAMENRALSDEITLHGEIDLAVQEKDVLRLRRDLAAMMQNEYSHSRSIEEIDDYLVGELEGSVLADFEAEMLMNSGLASDVAFHRELDRATGEGDIMQLRQSLEAISREERDRGSQVLGVLPRRRSLLWYAAASVIVLMLVFTSLLRHKSYTSQELYASYYKPYGGGSGVSRSAVSSSGSLQAALVQMDRGSYTQALGMLDKIGIGTGDGVSVSFYRGVAYQELGQYRQAIGSFGEVVSHGDNLLVEQSQWYIGLCYLRLEDREKASGQFRAIAAGRGYYRDQSRKILQQLE